MSASHGSDAPPIRAALDAARAVFGAYDRTPAPELWHTAQAILQQMLQRPELTGQALVSEARRIGLVSLPDAHALVALAALADRTTGPASTESERIQVREAWMALQHSVPPETFEPVPTAASSFAPPSAPPGTPGVRGAAPPPRAAASPAYAPPPSASWSGAPASGAASSTAAGDAPDALIRRRRLWPLVAVGVLVLALAGAASWWFLRGRNEQLYADGVAAYTRGAREVARAAFVELAQRTPDDARPLVYLGRMSREEADNARAKRFLTTAVRVAPTSAVAQRELGSVMLADGQPELARRFYVHALELDPTDRTAQGFLGCALARLQRADEAQRWLARAGAGEWQRCIAPPPMPLPTSQPPR